MLGASRELGHRTTTSRTQPGQSENTVSNRVMELVVAGLFMAVAAVVMWDSWRIGAGWAFDGPQAGIFPVLYRPDHVHRQRRHFRHAISSAGTHD